MDQNTEKENSQTTEEEETSEEPQEETQETPEETQEQTPPEEKDTPEEETSPKEEFSEREKRYYARMKKAEEEAKKVKDALAKSKMPISDVDAILEVQSATRGLDKTEIEELKLRASAMGVSLTEARDNENYLIWKQGHREKVEKEKALKPSTAQPDSQKPKTLDERLASAKTQKEKEEILDELGLNPLRAKEAKGL